MDPRVKTPENGLAQQHAIAKRCYEGLQQIHDALEQVRKLRVQLRDLRGRASQGALADAINALEGKLAALEGAGGGFRGAGGGGQGGASNEPSLSRLSGELLGLMGVVEGADVAPTTQAVAASEELQRILTGVLARWSDVKQKDVRSLNEQLTKSNLPALMF
jgi:hypothetical protein